MTVLLSWQGTLLCQVRATGALEQRSIDGIGDDVDLVTIDVPAGRLLASFTTHLRADDSLSIDIESGALQGWRITRSADHRSISLSRGSEFLRAVHQSPEVIRVPHAQDWESFLPLEQADLDVVRTILRHAWIIRPTGESIPGGAARLGLFFNLHLGSRVFDLRWQVPFDRAAWPHRLTLLREGWRIEQICRYRPLVYYSAFGNEAIMRQFSLSAHSLVRFGGYHGDVAVLTDHDPAVIEALLPAHDRPRCAVLRPPAANREAYMAARYHIVEWTDAWDYQPVLYVDTDVIFDADIAPLLRDVARSDRLSAPVEPSSPLMSATPVGSGLLQLDGVDPGGMHGFNSGTIGIPYIAAHASTLRLIGRVIANHATIKGRNALPYVDQEIANYVGYRTAAVDTVLLARYVRIGGEGSVSADGRCGLVHFWGVHGSARRADVMASYVDALSAVVG